MDPKTQEILDRTYKRRDRINAECQQISPSSSQSRKRRPLDDTANMTEAGDSNSLPKRPSFPTSEDQLYPVEELKRLSAEMEETTVAPPTPAASVDTPNFQRSTVNSSTRKARFAALAAEIDSFEVETTQVAIPHRYESPKGSPLGARKFGGDSASNSSPKMSPQPARKWPEILASPKTVTPVILQSEKRSAGGAEDVGIETFAVAKPRDQLESASSADETAEMIVVYNEKSSSDSDNSVSPAKNPATHAAHLHSNLRHDRSPASVTPKKVLFSEEIQRESVVPKEAIAAINAQTADSGDVSKVGKLASHWEQKIMTSGQKAPPAKSPQSVGKLVRPAGPPAESLPFGDKLKKFDKASATPQYLTPKLSEAIKCEQQTAKPAAKPVIRPASASEKKPAAPQVVVMKTSVTPSPAVSNGSSTESVTEVVKRQEIASLRNRWEVASSTGQLLQPGKALADSSDDITAVALRVFAPRAARPVSVPNFAQNQSTSSDPSPLEKAQSTVNIAEPEVKAAPVSQLRPSEDSDDGQRASTETESSCVSTDGTDDFELESYLNAAMANVDEMDMNVAPVEKSETFAVPSVAPLVHTISFYRNMTKTQSTPTHSKPVRVETPKQLSPAKAKPQTYRAESYKEKMRHLNEEVNRQQNVISQASRALNVCKSTDEFRCSTEEVEAEKLLLIATQKRTACLSEIERLGKLMINGAQPELGPFGTVNISDVSVPLKREFINANINGSEEEMIYYFICLIKHRDQVIATEMVSSHQAVLKQSLDFCNYVQLSPLSSDFVVTFDVYQLVTRREILTHAEKYRINTLGKHGKQKSTVSTSAHSVATPGGIRTTNFDLAGSVAINLQSLMSSKFALQGVKFNSPLETWVHLKLRCLSECSSVQEKGFLNWYEEVAKVGAWQRRWCVLEENQIKCWRYPDEEATKEPLNVIDLTMCANNEVKAVSKEMSARPHTFMLMMPLKTDKGFEGKIMLVSCDTKEEFQTWCPVLNEVFRSVRLWNPSPVSPSKFSTLV